jgi:hypothetical protein
MFSLPSCVSISMYIFIHVSFVLFITSSTTTQYNMTWKDVFMPIVGVIASCMIIALAIVNLSTIDTMPTNRIASAMMTLAVLSLIGSSFMTYHNYNLEQSYDLTPPGQPSYNCCLCLCINIASLAVGGMCIALMIYNDEAIDCKPGEGHNSAFVFSAVMVGISTCTFFASSTVIGQWCLRKYNA